MKEKGKKKNYIYTFGEEVANATTHGPMALLCLFALPFSAIWAYNHGGDKAVTATVGVSIFIISLFLMFLASTIYHVMRDSTPHKRVCKILDHIFIYFAIAGSYTPIALYVVGGWKGILIVCLQWAMVLFGIFYKSLSKRSMPKVSLTIYLIMGWTLLFFLPLVIHNTNLIFMILLGAGGVLYSIGAGFYAMKNFKYHHMIWHLFINLAAVCHYIAIVFWIY
ncbi:MAG: hemolysin III family protein [Clostridia bacterium]|nr:hemolysin III family protein [Clostridia bacterium]